MLLNDQKSSFVLLLLLRNHRNNAILIADDLDVAFLVFASGADGKGSIKKQEALPFVLGGSSETPDLHATEIGEEENVLDLGQSRPTIDGVPYDFAPHVVVVFGYRRSLAFRAAYPVFDFTGFALNATPLLKTDAAFRNAPTVVFAASAACRPVVHLFDCDIAHLGDIEIACLLVECESPWIAQAIRPDLFMVAVNVREKGWWGERRMARPPTRRRCGVFGPRAN